jgi:hypothetical protein
MQIYLGTDGTVKLTFPKSELAVALSVLRAIYTVSKFGFIKDAIEDIEVMMRPKLTLFSHYHFCSKCFMEIDDRVGDNFIHITTDNDDKYVHRTCPVLKENRPE